MQASWIVVCCHSCPECASASRGISLQFESALLPVMSRQIVSMQIAGRVAKQELERGLLRTACKSLMSLESKVRVTVRA